MSVKGRADNQSFVYPSLIPGLVAKAFFMAMTHKNQVKSNLGRATQEEEARDLWIAMPPTQLPSSTWHKQATDTHLLPCHAAEV